MNQTVIAKKRGGIQKGTEAGSKESKQLDGDVRVIAEAIAKAQTHYFYEIGHKNMLSERFSDAVKQAASLPELLTMGITVGCVPDGGMWFDGNRLKANRKLIAGFEAKHQQDGGNAIERWCKNFMLCKGMNPDVKYITFMSGPGAMPDGVLYKFGRSMIAANGPNCIFYYQSEGFSQEDIFNKMVHHLHLDLKFNDIKPFLPKTNIFNNIFAQ